MRLALFSDIHGNSIALDAVLADVEAAGGVDEYWALGDLVAFGPDPVGVVERLTALPNLHTVRGNTDRYITSADRPPPAFDAVIAEPELLPIFVEIEASCSWTRGAVTAAGWLDWLVDLPFEQRLTLPDGTRLLGIHATPQRDDDHRGLAPIISDDETAAALDGCRADLIVAGHTHWPMNRRVQDWHVINLDSVFQTTVPSMQATYMLLEADEQGYTVEHRWVDYDLQASIAATEHARHPGARYIIKHLTGGYIRHHWGEPLA